MAFFRNSSRENPHEGVSQAELASDTERTLTSSSVTVKFSDNRTFNLSVCPTQTISEIKEIVGKEAKVSPHSVNLVFAGHLLKDDRTVGDYNLGGQTILHAFCWSDDGLSGASANPLTPSGALMDSHKLKPPSSDIVNAPGFNAFFVFCKLCDSVKPGLLRVVCKTCESGLFLVNYGPSSWDDIASTTTLKGRCQNENCTSDSPRFYLRCSARHPGETDGSAAALCHVQSNCREIECIVCQDICSHVVIFPCPPGHVICLECFRQFAVSSLDQRQFVEHETHGYTLPCPAGCEDAFIEDSHHFLLMGREKYERFKNFGAEEYVLQNGGVLCPAPNCGMGIFPEDDDRLIKCMECKFESCRDCKRAYHFDSCHESLLLEMHNSSNLPVDRERAERACWEGQSLSLIGDIAKACPGCGTKTERDGGCMHIACTRCGTEWCWLCVKTWDRECQASHWFGPP